MPITIKCHGEYYAREGQLKLTKSFEEVVRAPSLEFFRQSWEKYTGTDDNGKMMFRTSTSINVRGMLKKKLIPMILTNKYQGSFVRVRRVFIDEVISEDGSPLDLPVNLLSISQLAMKIKRENIPLDPASYINVDELRTDIMEYEEDPETFKRHYATKSKKRQEEREFHELNNLNPLKVAPVSRETLVATPRGIMAVDKPTAATQAPF